ncbi:MAG: hypothetical protein PVF26_21565 [Desulfobacterales bacterium]|jgi:hypothetical protein
MENNEKSAQEEKKLKLDLREALTNGSDDDDEIIELKDEVIFPPKEKAAKVDLSDPLERKSFDDEPADKTATGLDTPGIETAEPEKVLQEDSVFGFEEEDESEADEEIPPLMVEKSSEMDGPDEVIEITEFDDILSDDDNEMITLAGEAEALESEEDEDEFLELIDVEEDSLPEEEKAEDKEDENLDIVDEIIQFDGLKENIEDVELEDFIKDSIDEEVRVDNDLEDDLTKSLGVEAGSEMNMLDQGTEAEDFDFNIDSSEISEKIDQLDTIFFDETEAQTDFEDEMVSDEEELEEAVAITGDAKNEDGDEDEREEIRTTDHEPSEGTLPPLEIVDFDDDHDEIEEPTAEDEEFRITEDEPSEGTLPPLEIAGFDDDHDEIEESMAEDEESRITEDEPSEGTLPPLEIAGFDDDHDEIEEFMAEDDERRITEDEPSEEPMPAHGIAAFDVDHDKIEESIERIIQQNYSEKIESMVVEVIEKAVSKEIDRLKNILLEDNGPESS